MSETRAEDPVVGPTFRDPEIGVDEEVVGNVSGVLGEGVEEEHPVIAPQKPPRKHRDKPSDVRKENNVPTTGPFPGGPRNNSVLKNFYDHVALRVWLGQVTN